MTTHGFEIRRRVDSRIQVNEERIMAANDGPSSVTFRSVKPPDPKSHNPVFVVQTPSYQTGISRVIRWRMEGRAIITGTNLQRFATGNGNSVAFRQFPLQNCCSALQVNINDTVVSLGSLNQFVSGLTKLGLTSTSMAQTTSSTPCAPDLWGTYEAAMQTSNGPFEPPADGAWSNYATGSRTMGIKSITAGPDAGGGLGSTTATIEFETIEPLLVSPLSYSEGGLEKALFGVNVLTVEAHLSQVHRMWSLAFPTPTADPAPAGETSVGDIRLDIDRQDLLLSFITANDRSIIERPLSYSYSYATVQFYTTAMGARLPKKDPATGAVSIAAGVTSNTIEVPVIPDKFIIYATIGETQRSNAKESVPDIFMKCNSLQMSMGSRGGLLAGATNTHLHEMTLRNGSTCPHWLFAGGNQFGSGFTPAQNNTCSAGWPVVIDVASDLSLPEGVCPGMNQRISFSITGSDWENQTGVDIEEPRLVILAVVDGVLISQSGSSLIALGGVPGVDDAAFDDATVYESAELSALSRDGGFGGGWADSLRSGAKRLGKFAGKALGTVAKAAPQIAAAAFGPQFVPVGNAIRKTALALGAGNGQQALGAGQIGGAVLGGRRR